MHRFTAPSLDYCNTLPSGYTLWAHEFLCGTEAPSLWGHTHKANPSYSCLALSLPLRDGDNTESSANPRTDMRGTLCHHLCSWNVLGAVWPNSPTQNAPLGNSFATEFPRASICIAGWIVLSWLSRCQGKVKEMEESWAKRQTEIGCGAPFVNLNPDVKRQVIIFQKATITKPITPINELSCTCKRFISSGFSEPGTLSFSIDDMTLTFIFAISSSLYSFPICWNSTGEYRVGEQSKQNNSYL